MTLDEIGAKLDALDAKLNRLENIESHLLDLLLPHRRANPNYVPSISPSGRDASFPMRGAPAGPAAPIPENKEKLKPKRKPKKAKR